jgi:hypothetical protein
MSAIPTLNSGLLYLNAAEVEDHVVRLSGPIATASVPTGYLASEGTEKWSPGSYGTPIDEWTDATHPTGDPSVSYSPPNKSWILNAEWPAGVYTIVSKQRKAGS